MATNQPPTGFNTPGRTAPQGENRENPPPLPGAMPQPDPSYPEAPTGIHTGATLPDGWPGLLSPADARNAANALILEIEDRVQILKKVVGRIA